MVSNKKYTSVKQKRHFCLLFLRHFCKWSLQPSPLTYDDHFMVKIPATDVTFTRSRKIVYSWSHLELCFSGPRRHSIQTDFSRRREWHHMTKDFVVPICSPSWESVTCSPSYNLYDGPTSSYNLTDPPQLQHDGPTSSYNMTDSPPATTWRTHLQLQHDGPTSSYNMTDPPPATTWRTHLHLVLVFICFIVYLAGARQV